MKEKTIQEFVHELASSNPTPGGGAVAALAASLTGALTCMVANMSLQKNPDKDLEAMRDKMVRLYEDCLTHVADDVEAYGKVVEAQKLPKKTDEEKAARKVQVQAALKQAALVPMGSAEKIFKMLDLTLKIAGHARASYISDLGVANFMALAGMMGAAINVEVNLHAIEDETFVKEYEAKLLEMEDKAHELFGQIETVVRERMFATA